MWTGETNIKGPKGDKGDPGADGAPGAPGGAPPATLTPLVEAGTGAVGVSLNYAREDHVHPLGPGGGGTPGTIIPKVESGTGAVGVSTSFSREDHVHPLGPGGGGSPVLSSDTPPVGAADNALWLETDTGILYFRWNDGNSTQWVAVASGGGDTVRFGVAQSLTEPQQVQARQNIYAAPFDALAYNGMQINGSMEVSQELGGAGTSVNGGNICDGWLFLKTSAATMTAFQLTGGSFPGFSSSMYTSVSVAGPATPASGDAVYISQRVEGYRISRLAWGTANAQPITIGFWTRHNRIGTYSVSARSSTGDRVYATTYTQAVSDAYEYKTVTIPGCIDGSWPADNTRSMSINFVLAAGSSAVTAANVWTSGAAGVFGATGQVNAVQSTADRFRITGVVVLPGIEAPSAARSPLIMRPYDQELLTCMRYYKKISYGAASVAVGSGHVAAAGDLRISVVIGLQLRALPIFTYSALTDFLATAGNASGTPTAINALGLGNETANFQVPVAALATMGHGGQLRSANANAWFSFDARL